jgi:glucokinase
MAQFIGIDLGGTKISGILIDDKGKILKKYVRPTEAEKKKNEIINNILEVINNLKTDEVKKIGIGTPGFVDKKGNMSCMPNIKSLENSNIKKELEKATGLNITIENDANCFALAETRLGAAKGCKNVIGVIIGTGVGAGIIINDEIYSGTIGGAGEIGHNKILIQEINENKENNSNNNNNVNKKPNYQIKEIEELISGKSMILRYNSLTGKNILNLSEIKKKDPDFKKIYEEFVFYTGIFFANIINTFNPDCIVVGGGVSNLDFYKEVKKTADKYSLKALSKCCKIVKNKLGADSGVIGAAELARG